MNDFIRNKILTNETLIPVGVIIVLLAPLIGGTWIFATEFGEFKNSIKSLETMVSMMDSNMKKDRWTYSMQKGWAYEVKELNPHFQVPDVHKVHDENNL